MLHHNYTEDEDFVCVFKKKKKKQSLALLFSCSPVTETYTLVITSKGMCTAATLINGHPI